MIIIFSFKNVVRDIFKIEKHFTENSATVYFLAESKDDFWTHLTLFVRRKEGNVLFNDTLNTVYIRL